MRAGGAASASLAGIATGARHRRRMPTPSALRPLAAAAAGRLVPLLGGRHFFVSAAQGGGGSAAGSLSTSRSGSAIVSAAVVSPCEASALAAAAAPAAATSERKVEAVPAQRPEKRRRGAPQLTETTSIGSCQATHSAPCQQRRAQAPPRAAGRSNSAAAAISRPRGARGHRTR